MILELQAQDQLLALAPLAPSVPGKRSEASGTTTHTGFETAQAPHREGPAPQNHRLVVDCLPSLLLPVPASEGKKHLGQCHGCPEGVSEGGSNAGPRGASPHPCGARADCSAVTLLTSSGKAGGGETEAHGLTVGPEGTPASRSLALPPVSAVASWPRSRSESQHSSNHCQYCYFLFPLIDQF